MASVHELEYVKSGQKWYGIRSYDNNKNNVQLALSPDNIIKTNVSLFGWQLVRLFRAVGFASDNSPLDHFNGLAEDSRRTLLDEVFPWVDVAKDDNDYDILARKLESLLAGSLSGDVLKERAHKASGWATTFQKYPDPKDPLLGTDDAAEDSTSATSDISVTRSTTTMRSQTETNSPKVIDTGKSKPDTGFSSVSRVEHESSLHEQLEELASRYATLQDENTSLQQKLMEYQASQDSSSLDHAKQCQSLNEQIAQLNNQNATLANGNRDILGGNHHLNSQLAAEKNKSLELEEECKTLNQRCTQLQDQLYQQNSNEQISQLEIDLSAERNKTRELEQSCKDLGQRTSILEHEIVNHQSTVSTLRGKLSHAHQRSLELQATINRLQATTLQNSQSRPQRDATVSAEPQSLRLLEDSEDESSSSNMPLPSEDSDNSETKSSIAQKKELINISSSSEDSDSSMNGAGTPPTRIRKNLPRAAFSESSDDEKYMRGGSNFAKVVEPSLLSSRAKRMESKSKSTIPSEHISTSSRHSSVASHPSPASPISGPGVLPSLLPWSSASVNKRIGNVNAASSPVSPATTTLSLGLPTPKRTPAASGTIRIGNLKAGIDFQDIHSRKAK